MFVGRPKQLKKIANRLQMSYSPDGTPELIPAIVKYEIFGSDQEVNTNKFGNLVNGKYRDAHVSIFDFTIIVTGARGNRYPWDQTMILFESDKLQLPLFKFLPKDKDDVINFSSDPYYDIMLKKSWVTGTDIHVAQGPNQPEIRQIFNEEMIEFLKKQIKKSKYLCASSCICGDSNELLIFTDTMKVRSRGIKLFIEETYQVFNRFIDSCYNTQ